jgi:hypothetical protein
MDNFDKSDELCQKYDCLTDDQAKTVISYILGRYYGDPVFNERLEAAIKKVQPHEVIIAEKVNG